MRLVLIAITTGLIVGLFVTPLWIRWLRARGYAQAIRDADELGYAVPDHASKKGTPSMGGVVIVAGTVLSYFVAHVYALSGPSASALLVLWLMVGLGAVGFADDYIKIFRQRSTGLRGKTKLIGQAVVAVIFGVLAIRFPDAHGYTPASQYVSFIRDTAIFLPIGVYLVWVWFMVAASSNAVNLTDGLDGLATGAAAIVFGAYVTIGLWQYGNGCAQVHLENCYAVRNPLDLAVVAAGLLGSCFGFLWWNASPAQIFMGDTGSLALGGAMAGLALCTQTELLLVILAGLFVVITLSVIIQVASFKATGKRVFLMTPLQHHFELKGWPEVTIVIRFWVISGLLTGIGFALFYAEWLGGGALGG
jgi:phospho-N-acetylmuramoyl-pentapeptide-transferase